MSGRSDELRKTRQAVLVEVQVAVSRIRQNCRMTTDRANDGGAASYSPAYSQSPAVPSTSSNALRPLPEAMTGRAYFWVDLAQSVEVCVTRERFVVQQRGQPPNERVLEHKHFRDRGLGQRVIASRPPPNQVRTLTYGAARWNKACQVGRTSA